MQDDFPWPLVVTSRYADLTPLNELLTTVASALLALVLLCLVWWLLIASEGVYLGQRVVIWLYDLYASRYDATKRIQPRYERALLAQPLLDGIAPHRAPMTLDVATGTGRLPLALLEHPDFQGQVIATDLSRGMLRIAARKTHGWSGRCQLLRCPAQSLPFDDGSFDVVTCLEALEFMPRPAIALEELMRVLRAGGLLFISNRIHTHLMPGKTWSHAQLTRLLRDFGAAELWSEPWQVDYERIFVRKTGDSAPVGARPPGELLRCPCCRTSGLMMDARLGLRCVDCGASCASTEDSVIDLATMRQRC